MERPQRFNVPQRPVSPVLVLPVEDGQDRRRVESQYVLLQLNGGICKLAVGELVQQRGIGFISQLVFARPGGLAGIEICIVQSKLPGPQVLKIDSILRHTAVNALQIQGLGIRARHFKSDGFEGADLGNEFEYSSKHSGAQPWFLIAISPLLLILGALQVVKKLVPGKGWVLPDHFVFPGQEGDSSHFRNNAADGVAKGSDGEINAAENV